MSEPASEKNETTVTLGSDEVELAKMGYRQELK
jgi:hypothetical protein